MISKERLEELIKEEKGCYILANAYTIGYIHLNKRYEPIIEVNEDGYNLWVFTSNEFDFRDCINDYNLFETKEDAKWELEMTATRTETLKLPKWEEFRKLGSFEFYGYHQRRTILFYDIVDDMIKLDDGNGDWYLFMKNHNKENYIEACKLAKKLFLGEEV